MGCSGFLRPFAVGATVGAAVGTNDSPARMEMKRADLSGAPGMEVITSIGEYKTGGCDSPPFAPWRRDGIRPSGIDGSASWERSP
jgi:hypothetical protein